MADVTRQTDVSSAREAGQQMLLQKQRQQEQKKQEQQQHEKLQQQQEKQQQEPPQTQEEQQQSLPQPEAILPTPTTAAPLRPSPLTVSPGPTAVAAPFSTAEELMTKTTTRPVQAIPAAHAPPGAGLAAAVASAVPSAVLRHAPAAIAGPLAATAAQAHVPGGGAAAARAPSAAVGRTVTTTWADCDPAVKSLVASVFAGAYAASVGGAPHPPGLALASPSRASAAERAFAANITWDAPLTFLRGRERARVAPRLMSLFFESAAFVPRVVTLALVGASPATHAWAAQQEQQQQEQWQQGQWQAGGGGVGGRGGMAPSGAPGAEAEARAEGEAVAAVPPGLGRIDVEGTLFLMVRPSLRRLLPLGLGRALLPIDVPVAGVWSIVARPSDDKVLSLTDRPSNWVKPPRLLRALWGTAATNAALVFTRW